MTRVLRPGGAEAEAIARGHSNSLGPTPGAAPAEPDEQNLWPATDSAVSGAATDDLDTEIGAAAKALFLASDLVRPGPGPLPFGAKARGRRERRREVDTLAAARRTELEKLLTARRNDRSTQAPRIGRGGRPRVVAILLISIVILIVAAGWWMSVTNNPTTPVESTDTASAATDPPGTGSVWIISPGTVTIPVLPDLIWPEGAATTWLAAWCPFDPTANPQVVEQRVREVMTPAGWEQFSATPGQLLTEGAPGMTASCDEPVARVVSRPPGDATVVVVLVSATRTITDANGTRQFRVKRREFVVRGEGGLWLVDTAAVGG